MMKNSSFSSKAIFVPPLFSFLYIKSSLWWWQICEIKMIAFKSHCANTKQHVFFFLGAKLKDFLYDRQITGCLGGGIKKLKDRGPPEK
jgi:hypothetical protein